jgi:hypothetical protein
MSVWNALWSADGPVKTINGTGNPQGSLAAPVGTFAVRPCDGAVYIKTGGGSTAYGWYLFNSPQWLNWQPGFLNGGARLSINRQVQTIDCGAATLINGFLPSQSSVATAFSPKRQYVGGYTTAVANNTFLYRLTTSTDGMPTQRLDDSLALNFCEWDLFWDVVTTPRSNSAAGSTDLTNVRIWAGGVWGSSNVQAVGGTVSSDTLATEWPTALSGADGLFGAAFRFSTAVPDAGWVVVTTARVAGAYAQTVTPIGAIAINTAYRLRLRYVLTSGVLTCYASINDGTEVAITGNVAPVAPFTAAQTQPFQPLASIRTLGAASKSIAVSQVSLNYGAGVGAC